MEMKNYCILSNESCKDAMKKIDKNPLKILFIIDNDYHLLASLTDGDIRRFLIRGGSLDCDVIKAGNCNPKIAFEIEDAKKMYDRDNYKAIPIVKDNILVDIYMGFEQKMYKTIKNVQVVINAGGKGTRLEPYTRIFPKPLIPVGDLPIVEHIMKEFGNYGLNDFSLIVNYKKELIKTYFNELEKPYNIKWVTENVPLGTGGGLSLLRNDLNSTFFFTNCDILIKADYESIIRYHKSQKNIVTMICAYKHLTIPYGIVEMGKNGTIDNMKEKPEFSFLTNTGMYIVEPQIMQFIEDNVSIGFPDIIKNAQDHGAKVGIYPISEEEWMDMGQLDELEKMRIKLYGN